MAKGKNTVVGYGAMENKEGVFSISPLYANENRIAWQLWKILLGYVPLRRRLAVFMHASNQKAQDMCKHVGLMQHLKSIAMYSRHAYPCMFSRVYFVYGGSLSNV